MNTEVELWTAAPNAGAAFGPPPKTGLLPKVGFAPNGEAILAFGGLLKEKGVDPVEPNVEVLPPNGLEVVNGFDVNKFDPGALVLGIASCGVANEKLDGFVDVLLVP